MRKQSDTLSFSAVEGQDKIQGIKINGVTCTEDTIKDGSYKLQRPFAVSSPRKTERFPKKHRSSTISQHRKMRQI